jgi:protein TonB
MNANAKVDVVRSAEPAQPEPQPKKPSLGEVKLAAPTVTRRGNAQNASDPEPAIEGSTDNSSSADPGAGIFAGNPKQPAAPVAPPPVGGDVKTAKLISSVPPVYSTLAKAQHISGDVKVDALIDATGHVTTMKVVSGPTLLHQSAMEALRQWKYQPATLDGKAVPMHLTVTIQFRMQ